MAQEAIINVRVEGTGKGKQTIGELESEIKEASQASKQLGDDLGNGIKAADLGATSLKTRLREMKEELQGMDSESQAFRKLAAEAGQLEDKIADVNNRVKLLSSDTKNLDTLVGAGQGIAGGFQAASGAMALFGQDSEQVQKALKNVIAIQGVLNGVQTVANVLNKDHIVGMQIRMALEKGQIALTKAWTAVQVVFNAVLSANPIGLIVIGIAALTAGIIALIDPIKKFISNWENLYTVMLVLLGPIGWIILAYQKLFGEEAQLANARELAEKKRKEAFEAEIADINKRIAENKRAAEEFRKAKQDEIDINNKKITILENEGKSSYALRLQVLEDNRAIMESTLNEATEYVRLQREKWEARKTFSGLSEEDFRKQMKNQGIDLENLEQQANEIIANMQLDLQVSESEITAFKREENKKRLDNEKKTVEDVGKEREKEYQAELKRIQDLQKQRNALLLEIEKAENAYLNRFLTKQEIEENAVREKYFKLIEEAEQFGIDNALLIEAQEAEILDIKKKYADEEDKLLEEKAEKEKEQRQNLVDETIATAENLISIAESFNTIANDKEIARIKKKQQAGEQLSRDEIKRLENQQKIEKAIALAKVATDTAKGISAAVAAGAGLPFPANIPAIISGISAVLAGVAQATKILNAPAIDTSSGSLGVDTSTGGEVQDLNTNNVGSINNGSTYLNNEPQKIYVVESDITNTQNDVSAIVKQATWG
jgi:hypothetical protein